MHLIGKVQLLLDITLIVSATLMILISPYTKVEESFNVQAIHDFINIGTDEIGLFDHVSFPGSVKRTCLGALGLSLPLIFLPDSMKNIGNLLISLAILIHKFLPTSINLLKNENDISQIFKLTKISQLLVSRFILSFFSCLSIIHLRRSVVNSCSKNSKLIGFWFSLLFYPLPHILYYSSRFLPNFICFPLTNLAISLFISGDITRSITILIFTGIIFRFEILVFTMVLIILCITGFLRNGNGLITIREGIVSVLISSLMSIFLCSRIDSYFWDVEFIIPEFDSFVFNIIGGNSSKWGVESYFAYFFKYLPKLFISQFDIVIIFSTIFFILSLLKLNFFNNNNSNNNKDKKFNFKIDYVNYGVGTITTLMWTSIIYILLLSFNGHKEWRFLIYTIPIFCIGSASTIEWLISKNDKFFKKILIILMILLYLFSLICSFLFTFISSWNYTGGDMVQKLNLRLINQFEFNKVMLKPIIVHWDIGTCMNGGSLFLQISDNKIFNNKWEFNEFKEPKYWIIYDKTENDELLNELVDDFDYWVQYDNEEIIKFNDENYEWVLIDIYEGYNKINVNIIKNLIMNPTEFLNNLQNGGLNYIKNVLDLVIEKKVRGRLWEKSLIETNNDNNNDNENNNKFN